MSFELARTVADAVLYEGYLLYPYRSSARKNQVRWQFGILGPAGAATAGTGEEPMMRAECLLEADAQTVVDVRLRFLQVQSRLVEQALDNAGTQFSPVPELRVADATWLTWDEAVEQEIDLPDLALGDLEIERTVPVEVAGGEETEPIHDAQGVTVGRLVRRRRPLSGVVRITAHPVAAPPGVTRLRVLAENTTAWVPDGDRETPARHSFVGTHLLLAARGGAFISLLEPPEDAADAARACANHRCWPVLVGEEGSRDVVLASPIILYDYPAVAAESAGDLFDSTEIDEILTLRVMTLTEDEKLAARATDPRAGAIIDRCDAMSPAEMERLHGALRYPRQPFPDAAQAAPPAFGSPLTAPASGPTGPPDFAPDVPWWDPGADSSVSPGTDSVRIAGVPVAKGSRVRLHPSRRADAQDVFLAEQVATVTAVYSDVDGNTHVAVVLNDDPAADLHEWYGRYYYFGPEELEPLTPEVES